MSESIIHQSIVKFFSQNVPTGPFPHPPPAEPPPAAKGAKSDEKVTSKTPAQAAPPATEGSDAKPTAPPSLAASEVYHRDTPVGRTTMAPGEGAVTEVPEPDRQAMFHGAVQFYQAAERGDRDGMKRVCTSRLGESLVDNLDRYQERLMRGMAPTLASMKKGVQPGQVRSQDGHFEIELMFADGTSRGVMMVVESGQWRVNRL